MHGIPLQAFCPTILQEEKDKATRYALEKATERRESQREMAAKNQSNEHYSSCDSKDYYPGATSRGSDHDAFALINGQKQFFLNLEHCLPLTTSFEFGGSKNNKHCYCPCGKQMKKWRENADPDVEMLFDNTDWKGSPCRVFTPTGLMQHLKVEGKECILHYGTRMYLENLFGNDALQSRNLLQWG